jgi:hypothetical protein
MDISSLPERVTALLLTMDERNRYCIEIRNVLVS